MRSVPVSAMLLIFFCAQINCLCHGFEGTREQGSEWAEKNIHRLQGCRIRLFVSEDQCDIMSEISFDSTVTGSGSNLALIGKSYVRRRGACELKDSRNLVALTVKQSHKNGPIFFTNVLYEFDSIQGSGNADSGDGLVEISPTGQVKFLTSVGYDQGLNYKIIKATDCAGK